MAQKWELLIIYILSWIVLVGTILSHCKSCVHLECGKKPVPEEVREIYRKEPLAKCSAASLAATTGVCNIKGLDCRQAAGATPLTPFCKRLEKNLTRRDWE